MVSAFDNILTILGEETQTIPLIFDSPHSGNIYPNDFKHNTTFEKLRQAEDSYVDELYNEASDIGAILLKANFPRSYIDPNRAETDFSTSEISDFSKDLKSWEDEIKEFYVSFEDCNEQGNNNSKKYTKYKNMVEINFRLFKH